MNFFFHVPSSARVIMRICLCLRYFAWHFQLYLLKEIVPSFAENSTIQVRHEHAQYIGVADIVDMSSRESGDNNGVMSKLFG